MQCLECLWLPRLLQRQLAGLPCQLARALKSGHGKQSLEVPQLKWLRRLEWKAAYCHRQLEWLLLS
jgi:hypothetical protein